jgi:hypothetical protein
MLQNLLPYPKPDTSKVALHMIDLSLPKKKSRIYSNMIKADLFSTQQQNPNRSNQFPLSHPFTLEGFLKHKKDSERRERENDEED